MLHLVALSFAALLALAPLSSAHADVMTVRQVRDLFAKGQLGELAATSYAQGVYDGLITMETLRRSETGEQREFCGLYAAYKSGRPVEHPAARTRELLDTWEKQGRSLDVVFGDLALNYLSAQYGCPKGAKPGR